MSNTAKIVIREMFFPFQGYKAVRLNSTGHPVWEYQSNKIDDVRKKANRIGEIYQCPIEDRCK